MDMFFIKLNTFFHQKTLMTFWRLWIQSLHRKHFCKKSLFQQRQFTIRCHLVYWC